MNDQHDDDKGGLIVLSSIGIIGSAAVAVGSAVAAAPIGVVIGIALLAAFVWFLGTTLRKG
jgi:hypothetical protein